MPGLFFAPGRVNLIGEHIDYLGGLVLPFALRRGVFALVRPNGSKGAGSRFRWFSQNQGFVDPNPSRFQETNLASGYPFVAGESQTWVNYPMAAIKMVADQWEIPPSRLRGLDFFIAADLPPGSGLSSSAAIEVLAAWTFLWWQKRRPNSNGELLELARICQRAENELIGVPCGIMDQAAIALGKEDHFLRLDCRSLDFQQVQVNTKGLAFLIIHSGKSRQLAESKYEERLTEARQLNEILVHKGLWTGEWANLAHFPATALPEAHSLLPNPLFGRLHHAVEEQSRVLEMIDLLRRVPETGEASAKRSQQLGDILTKSHDSLRDDYEVSCPELNFLAERFTGDVRAVSGCRLTGAGFGGSLIAIVDQNKLENDEIGFWRSVGKVESAYKEKFGYTSQSFLDWPGPGPSRIKT